MTELGVDFHSQSRAYQSYAQFRDLTLGHLPKTENPRLNMTESRKIYLLGYFLSFFICKIHTTVSSGRIGSN